MVKSLMRGPWEVVSRVGIEADNPTTSTLQRRLYRTGSAAGTDAGSFRPQIDRWRPVLPPPQLVEQSRGPGALPGESRSLRLRTLVVPGLQERILQA